MMGELNASGETACVLVNPHNLAPCLRNINILRTIIDSNVATYDEKVNLLSVGLEHLFSELTTDVLRVTDAMMEKISDVADDAAELLKRYRDAERACRREQ